MNEIQTIEQHEAIRNTVGYDGIKDIELYDLPAVIDFLVIVNNYIDISNIENKTYDIHKDSRRREQQILRGITDHNSSTKRDV